MPGLLYCGTEYGMYISYDYGSSWKSFQLNLPEVPITDLTIKNNDLVVATQGRSFWVLDDLAVVQNQQKNITSKSLFLFPVEDAYLRDGGSIGETVNAGTNPPNGVVFNFYLKNFEDSNSVKIDFYDSAKHLIKSFSNKPAKDTGKAEIWHGMNKFVWDMRYTPAEKVDSMILWNDNIPGPKAIPGIYSVKIRTAKDSVEEQFRIKANPNFKQTREEYAAQFNFLIKVRDKFSEVQKGIKNIRELRSQINDFIARQGKDTAGPVKNMADSILKKMTKVEEALYQTKARSSQDVLNYPIRLNDQIGGLYDYAASGNYPPTKQVTEAYDFLAEKADAELATLAAVLKNDIPAFNQLIREKQLPLIGLPE